MSANPTTPPATPPAIAATFVELFLPLPPPLGDPAVWFGCEEVVVVVLALLEGPLLTGPELLPPVAVGVSPGAVDGGVVVVSVGEEYGLEEVGWTEELRDAMELTDATDIVD